MSIKQHISPRAFNAALGVVAVVYALSFSYAIFNAQSYNMEQTSKLATYRAPLEEPRLNASSDQDQKPDDAGQLGVVAAAPVDQLTPAPIAAITEVSTAGLSLPIRGKDGGSPFDLYKRPFTNSGSNPVIALAILDYGFSKTKAQKILSMFPDTVSLGMSPYTPHIDEFRKAARADGHEIWLQLPIENESYPANDMGPHTVLRGATLKSNIKNLLWSLSQTTGYAGVMSNLDDIFASKGSMTDGMFKDLYSKRGLGYWELNPDGPSHIEALAFKHKSPYIKTHIMLDQEPAMLEENLKALENLARQHGVAVGVIHPYENSLTLTAEWLQNLEKRGYTIAPISAISEIVPHD